MAKIGQADLISRFKKIDASTLQFITPVDQIKQLLSNQSNEPEFLKQAACDPNQIYISPTATPKKVFNHPVKGKEMSHKTHQHHQQGQQRQKVYRPGPFALFYKINQGKQNKDIEVWYYKNHKDIIGPVSSYNMDKMVFYKTIQDDTKVAYQSIDKFVKFKKIKAIVQEEQEKQKEA